MSLYRSPRLRVVRRLGKLPGLTRKFSIKTNPPGQHGMFYAKKASLFNVRLREKQKLRYHYCVSERQLLNYVKKSRKKKGSSGKLLLTFLEMRLDNLVFRLGFAPTIMAAKQLVNHGHISINFGLINIPSYGCQPKDVIAVRGSSVSQILVKKNMHFLGNILIPQHLFLNKENLEAKVISLVNRKSISLLINELLVIEYYSRKL